jgi:hypothetical protein
MKTLDFRPLPLVTTTIPISIRPVDKSCLPATVTSSDKYYIICHTLMSFSTAITLTCNFYTSPLVKQDLSQIVPSV